ncbi:MAG: UbiA prenyltransferase family protein [Chloroflexota bacterium]|nr:UbiA prenyltransferase family protein [Chloroflexota bacterium]MDE2948287.1 UbiA prenyltransferase family protein [Chloroflexota bacterium]
MNSTRPEQQGSRIAALIRLSRWREHVPFTIPLTIIGGLLAAEPQAVAVDWRLFAVLAANIAAMSFAFMLNNIEDAPDDALDRQKRLHNVISSGLLSRREGIILTAAVFVLSFLLYAAVGPMTLALGGATLALCYLYSARPFRFKARPISDVASHSLMLSGLLITVGYFTYGTEPGEVWLVIGAAILFSAYGQFYNQVEDFEVDKEAGLKNTAVLLGKAPTSILSHLSLVVALLCMLAAIWQGLFPEWLGTILIIGAITTALFPWEFDMRGNLARDGANVQRPGLIIANLLALVWLASNLGLITIL